MTKKKVIVIGGGIVGLSTAYYLLEEGHEVQVIDKGRLDSGASYVNAGYLTPSHIIPMAAPGMVTKGVRWMFNASSPFYIKPRADLNLIRWGLKFMRACTPVHVQRSMQSLLEINLFSKALYLKMQQSKNFDFHLESKGLLMAYKTKKAKYEEAETVNWAKDLGIEVNHYDRDAILNLQPNAPMDIDGAFWYESDAHSTPELFMKNLKEYLEGKGVQFSLETQVKSIKTKGKHICSVETDQGSFAADEYVIATGAWSENVLKELGIRLSIQAGKGYRLNVIQPTGIDLPAILLEAKVAVTPMQGFTRFGGTMELSGINTQINTKRVAAIAKAARDYYPNIAIPQSALDDVKSGLRPLSPDGLPFIGRHSAIENIVLATGHAMMGWSLGPATGKLVSELVSNQTPSIDIKPFNPQRD
jgi:D-amino-acid dehydrogenase